VVIWVESALFYRKQEASFTFFFFQSSFWGHVLRVRRTAKYCLSEAQKGRASHAAERRKMASKPLDIQGGRDKPGPIANAAPAYQKKTKTALQA